MIVPVARAAGLDPPTALPILNHQLLQLLIELLVGKIAGFMTTFEFGVAAVCFSKIHSLILRLGHLALASIGCLFVNLEGKMASPVAWAQVLRVRSRVSRITGVW